VLLLAALGLVASACDPDPSTEEDGLPATEGTQPTDATTTIPYGYEAAQAAGSDTYWESTSEMTLYDLVIDGVNYSATAPTDTRYAFGTEGNPLADGVANTQLGTVRDQDTYTGFNEPGHEGSCPTGQVCASGIQYGGTPSGAGCRGAVNRVRMVSTIFRSTLWDWHHGQYWCWLGGYMVNQNPGARTTPSNMDSLWSYDGRIYREWYCYSGNGRGGCYAHKGLRKDKFSSSTFGWPNNKYPWMWYRKHADGTYSWDRGIEGN